VYAIGQEKWTVEVLGKPGRHGGVLGYWVLGNKGNVNRYRILNKITEYELEALPSPRRRGWGVR
jgi:hypothetical protein